LPDSVATRQAKECQNTYLTCEENISDYFGATRAWKPNAAQRRYGFSQDGVGYDWHRYDRRFDLAAAEYRHEENRFGWVVEIDPFDARQTPVKRTALGRFKHEGAALVTGKDGRLVVYMGDDQRFEYIYKFVSADNAARMRRQGISPLDQGTLYAARFDEDGSGQWLALTLDNPALQERFEDLGELLIHTRIAADLAGATPMDRPEWTTVAPDGSVYCSLTNNTRRTEINAANPMAPNQHGHIIRWQDSNSHTGTDFTWDIFINAGDSDATEQAFSNPDGLWADPDGRLFIATDGKQREGMNNQLLVADTNSGEVRRLLSGVSGDEITGITTTPDRRTLFVNIQHPGKGNPALTNFPLAYDGNTIPRDSTLVITRKDGGIVGS
jgi:secreted PhoX family phosphatase